MWFLTVCPCSSQSCPSDRTAGIPSRTFKVKNKSISVTYTIFFIRVCTSPMAVISVVGLLDVVKISNAAEFNSLLLIMCIDASESTANYLSSGSKINGAGKLDFSLFLFFEYFWPTSTLLHGHNRSCQSVSSSDRSSTFGALGLR